MTMLMRVSLSLLVSVVGLTCAQPVNPAKADSELMAFREGIYRHFPDIGDSALRYDAVMARLDSLCRSFRQSHSPELEAYFTARLNQMPEVADVDTMVFERVAVFPWSEATALDSLYASYSALFRAMNAAPR
jgi:hypothetical protein